MAGDKSRQPGMKFLASNAILVVQVSTLYV